MSDLSDLTNKISASAQAALSKAGITDLQQLSKMTEDAVKKLPGMDAGALENIRDALKSKGLDFAGK